MPYTLALKTEHSKKRPVRVGLISLGCAKNLADAEIMLGTLLKDGIEVTNNASEADVVIVNTCSFIDSAQEESVDAILESSEVREARNRGQGLIVSGCLPQRFREDLPKLLPEVDAFMGIDQVERVNEIVHEAISHRAQRLSQEKKSQLPERKTKVMKRLAVVDKSLPVRGEQKLPPVFDVTSRPVYIPDYGTPRFRLTPNHFAYVKIAEGCN